MKVLKFRKPQSPQLLEEIAEAKKAIQQLAGALDKIAIGETWVEPKFAQDKFGLSSSQLRDRVKSGEFSYGVHYINCSSTDKPVYRYSLSAIEELYSCKPEQRKINR